jgi:hypothetical protein
MLKCPFCCGAVDVRAVRALAVFPCPHACGHDIQLDTDSRAQPVLCCSPDEWDAIQGAVNGAEEIHDG